MRDNQVPGTDSPAKLLLEVIDLSQEWVELAACVSTNQVECTSDVDWEWCTDKERAASAGALRGVRALINHILTEGKPFGYRPRFEKGDTICFVRAKASSGKLWIKLTN